MDQTVDGALVTDKERTRVFIVMSQEFRREVDEHRLVFTCEACAHFCDQRIACAVLYPTTPHRAATVEAAKDGERIFFCKMFEAS